MNAETLKNFAADLQARRKEKDVTLEQIANRTRIDIKFLKAIEEANFTIMPEVYMRAFIKEFAQSVDLDPAVTLKNYDLAKEGKSLSADEPQEQKNVKTEKKEKKVISIDSEVKPVHEDNSKKSSDKGTIIFGIAGAVIIIAAVLVYFFVFNNGSQEIVKETPFSQVLEEKSRFEVTEDKIKEEQNEVPAQQDSLYLKITATDTCWIKALIDDNGITEFMLYPNRSKTITSVNKFNLLVGNSRGLSFFLNDEELSFERKNGRLPNVEISVDGIELLNSEIVFPNESTN